MTKQLTKKTKGAKRESKSIPELDLHGFRIDEVPDAVDRFLVKETNRGSAQVRIIHGRGTGAVKKKTIEWLKLGGYQHRSENEGALIVFMD